jgi:hypothetical protein
MTATIVSDGPQSKWLKVHVKGNATAVANSLGSIANPEGVALHINEAYMYTIAPCAGSADLDVGIGATGADSTDLLSDISIDGIAASAVHYVVGKDASSQAAATSPKGLLWAATTYLNFYNHNAAECAAWEAYFYLHYIRIGEDLTRA